MNKRPCNECSRKIWDPMKRGFTLVCFGNDLETFVTKGKKELFTIPECKLYREDTSTVTTDIPDDQLHDQYGKAAQSMLEAFQ
jgi:hypothetical protein